MLPAARLLDTVTHDMLVPSGMISAPMPGRVPTVIIENQPAARIGDLVACTGAISAGIVHPPPPAPVPIALGNFTVITENSAQSRWIMDTAGCGTFLGDPKLVATRKTLIGF